MLVRDIWLGSGSSNPKWLTNVNGTLFFTAFVDGIGRELWKSDGTTLGTQLFGDIFPGPRGSFPAPLTNVSGTLFFAADDGAHGVELWHVGPPDTTPPTVTGFLFDFETRHSLRMTFDEMMNPVRIDPSDVTVQPAGGGPAIPLFSVHYDVASRTATFFFSSLLNDGNYVATLVPGSLTDLAGNPPVGSHTLPFFVLAGDANRDRSVNIADFSILAARFNLPGTFSQGDFNYNGMVDIGDFSILAGKFGTTLPAPRPAGMLGASGAGTLRVAALEAGAALRSAPTWSDRELSAALRLAPAICG